MISGFSANLAAPPPIYRRICVALVWPQSADLDIHKWGPHITIRYTEMLVMMSYFVLDFEVLCCLQTTQVFLIAGDCFCFLFQFFLESGFVSFFCLGLVEGISLFLTRGLSPAAACSARATRVNGTPWDFVPLVCLAGSSLAQPPPPTRRNLPAQGQAGA